MPVVEKNNEPRDIIARQGTFAEKNNEPMDIIAREKGTFVIGRAQLRVCNYECTHFEL